MRVSLPEARSLCTKAELALVRESTPASVKKLTPQRLRSNVEQARRLRDKYRDLAAQQRREQRGKGTVRGTRPSQGNERTVRKQQLFAEVLEAFETQLERAGREAPASTGKAAGKSERVAKKVQRRAQKNVRRAERESPPAAAEPAIDEPKEAVAAEAGPRRPKKQDGAGPSKKKGSPVPLSSMEAMAARSTGLQQHSKSSKGMRVLKNKQRANAPKIRGHVSGRGRRSQARRDAR